MSKENEVLDLESIIEEEGKNELIETKKSTLISKDVQSTMKDKKKLFNLNDNVDFKIFDFVGQEITVKDIVIKTYLKEKINEETGKKEIDEETGEVKTVSTIVSIIIDETCKSYVTASKFFANRLKELFSCYENLEELREDLNNGIKIKIILNEMPDDKKKKYLSFEWI